MQSLHLFPEGSLVYSIVRGSLAPLFLSAFAELHVIGLEHIPHSGPLILVSNHVDNLDSYVLACQMQRVVNFMARSNGVHSRWLGLYWRLMATIPADREGFHIALSLLQKGHVIGVFSEGVITPSLLRAKPGMALLALRSGAPVLPCAVWGTEHVLRGPNDLLHRQPVYVRFGPPRVLKRRSGRGQELADQLMMEVAALLPPAYRGYYAAAVASRECANTPADGIHIAGS